MKLPKISTTGRSGQANIDIPLKGSKQDGSVHVVGWREGGRWTYHRMIMTPDVGEPRLEATEKPERHPRHVILTR